MSTTQSTKPIPHDERPKALRYKDKTDAIEEMIIDALPKVVAKLISMAEDGDVRASRYLVDRILGRVARVPLPPNGDTAPPHQTSDSPLAMLRHKDDRDAKTRSHMGSLWNAVTTDQSSTRNPIIGEGSLSDQGRQHIPGIGSVLAGHPTLDAIREDLARWQSNGKLKPTAA